MSYGHCSRTQHLETKISEWCYHWHQMVDEQVNPRSVLAFPNTPMSLIMKLSSSIGVWKPWAPFQVIFLELKRYGHKSAYRPASTYWMAILVPSATRIKSCAYSEYRRALRSKGMPHRKSMHYHGPHRFLNHIREHAQHWRDGLIITRSTGGRVYVYGSIRTRHPFNVRCMNGVLNLRMTVG